MRLMDGHVKTIVSAAAAVITLSACSGVADSDGLSEKVDLSEVVDRSAFAGDMTFSFSKSFSVDGRELPLNLGIGLTAETQTRLGARAFFDLREIQVALPDLLTGSFEPSCGVGIDMRFQGAEARAQVVKAKASADVRIYVCRDRGTEAEQRGGLLLKQTIDIGATVEAGLEAGCLAFSLSDLDLAPRGLVGGLATMLGVTKRGRAAVLAEARRVFSENPVCPDLPPALASLDPRFASVSLQEIGNGGIGAALSGSVDLKAATIVELLALFVDQSQPSDGPMRVAETSPGRAALRIDESLDIRGEPITWGLDLELLAEDETRIRANAVLDLRELQAQLPTLIADEVLVDVCGTRITVQSFDAEANGTLLAVLAPVTLDIFECSRTGPTTWERGELKATEPIAVRADLSAELIGECVVFGIRDLRRDPGADVQSEAVSERIEMARALALDAVDLLLEGRPFCPELPPELLILEPRFDRGTMQEIGEGGVGVAFAGSIDVSPSNLIELLRFVQANGPLPQP